MVKPAIYTISPDQQKEKKAVEAGVFDEIPIKTDYSDTDHIVKVGAASSSPPCTRRTRCLVIAMISTLILIIGAAAIVMLFARCRSEHKDGKKWDMETDEKFEKFMGKDQLFGDDDWRGKGHGHDSGVEDDEDRIPHPHGDHHGGSSSHEHGQGHQHGGPHGPHGSHGPRPDSAEHHGEGEGRLDGDEGHPEHDQRPDATQ